ncbi:MAG: CotH kinase family protein, partial [Acidimicrobiales bacterium]|nr:CotH kinase family protein [Acidimicrobiales bacterium]
VERPDSTFMASYFGGEKDDQDSLKNHEEVIDGNGQAYAELLALIQNNPNNFGAGYRDFSSDAAYQAVQGNLPNGTPDRRRRDYLDVPNLIDYMIHNMYSAAGDWPGNNYIGRDRNADSTRFKYFSWDNEHGMKSSVSTNRTTPPRRDNASPPKFHHSPPSIPLRTGYGSRPPRPTSAPGSSRWSPGPRTTCNDSRNSPTNDSCATAAGG